MVNPLNANPRARSERIDVLVVGAGPVGLFLANECARRGLRWRLVEARAGQSQHSKALAIMPRTLEIFDMAGLAVPFLEVANRVTQVAVISHGRRLAQMHFAPDESPYPFVAMVPQNETERLLAQELLQRGGLIEYGTKLVSAVQRDDHVVAQVEHQGTTQDVIASFVVGCDGSHSAVRHLLDLSFVGTAYDASFMLADIETNDALPADEMQLCPTEMGPLAIFPMSGTRRRLVATIDSAVGDAPSLSTVQDALASRGPHGIEARGVHWSTYFRIHHRQVDQLRVGRMFLAGDAAHIHSPIGGQGMNTGLHDVWNLAWKLDLAARGVAGEQLLSTYTAERRPVIKAVIDLTHFMTQAMGTPNKLAQAVRDTVIPIVSRLTPFQHAFVERLSQLGVSYRGSPIVEGAGERYFHESLQGGTGLRSRFILFLGPEVNAATIAELKQLCAGFSELVELRASQQHGMTLVRPDGYAAWKTTGHADHSTLADLRSVLQRQTM